MNALELLAVLLSAFFGFALGAWAYLNRGPRRGGYVDLTRKHD